MLVTPLYCLTQGDSMLNALHSVPKADACLLTTPPDLCVLHHRLLMLLIHKLRVAGTADDLLTLGIGVHPWTRIAGYTNCGIPLQAIVAAGYWGYSMFYPPPFAAPRLQVLSVATHIMPLLSCSVQGDAPVVWRGPIVNNAIDRFLMGTSWGDLHVLVVDMPPGMCSPCSLLHSIPIMQTHARCVCMCAPPAHSWVWHASGQELCTEERGAACVCTSGTGDAQIGLGQRLPLSGAVIVSTPQDVALLDARWERVHGHSNACFPIMHVHMHWKSHQQLHPMLCFRGGQDRHHQHVTQQALVMLFDQTRHAVRPPKQCLHKEFAVCACLCVQERCTNVSQGACASSGSC